jgi:polysaccharide pyruvyl transferase WcaK-like protein
VIPRGARGLRELGRCAREADRILIAGGGLFQDDDSRAKMPYWALRISLLRILNSRIAGHSIGAGPLRHAESRLAARFACRALTSVSARDRLARDTLAACTSRRIDVVPDPAFMLEPAPRQAALELLRDLGLTPGRPFIAVAVRRWFHARGGFIPNILKARVGMRVGGDDGRFQSLLDVIATSLIQLAGRLDADVLLLPSYNVPHEADDVACESLAQRLGSIRVKLAKIADPQLYKAVLGMASLMISSRMHPLIHAASMGIPLVGLSYNPKFDGLFDLLEMPYPPLRLDEFPDRWGAREIVGAAEAALGSRLDLRKRSELLATVVRRQTLAVTFGDSAGATMDAADA